MFSPYLLMALSLEISRQPSNAGEHSMVAATDVGVREFLLINLRVMVLLGSAAFSCGVSATGNLINILNE
jgi:hypothetical protein